MAVGKATRLAAGGLLVSALIATAPSSASMPGQVRGPVRGLARGPAQPATLIGTTEFDGVAASSPANAWVVGHTSTIPVHTLILHWNGKTWRRVPSPNAPGQRTSSYLFAVATTSRTNAWAVGESNVKNLTPLIEHWNGKTWKVIPSANIGRGFSDLSGVAIRTASDVWAVGSDTVGPGGNSQTLVERWNGTAWARVPSPNVTSGNGDQVQIGLGTIAVISRNNAWADGSYLIGSGAAQTLIEHWDGTKWSIAASPDPQGAFISTYLHGLAAISPSEIFATGAIVPDVDPGQNVILRWNGSSWHSVPSPVSDTASEGLSAAAAVSPSDAWAVGGSDSQGNGKNVTLILHWNGTKWQAQPAPLPPGAASDGLGSITAVSAKAAWAVGGSSNADGSVQRPLLMHWNGTRWTVVTRISA